MVADHLGPAVRWRFFLWEAIASIRSNAAVLAAFGLLLGAFGSGITLRRFLRV